MWHRPRFCPQHRTHLRVAAHTWNPSTQEVKAHVWATLGYIIEIEDNLGCIKPCLTLNTSETKDKAKEDPVSEASLGSHGSMTASSPQRGCVGACAPIDPTDSHLLLSCDGSRTCGHRCRWPPVQTSQSMQAHQASLTLVTSPDLACPHLLSRWGLLPSIPCWGGAELGCARETWLCPQC